MSGGLFRTDGQEEDRMRDVPEFEPVTHEPRPQPYGRPRIDPSERRTRPLRVFLSESEERRLRENASAAGMNRHDYVRALIAGHKPRARGGDGCDPRLLHELNAVGNNLNQAVRDMNAGSTRRHDWDALRGLLEQAILKVALGPDSQDANHVH